MTDDDDWTEVIDDVDGALAALVARAIEGVPEAGGFDTLDEELTVTHPAWTQGVVRLRIAASPRLTPTGTEPGDGRYLQVRVVTPGGGSETAQILVSGSKDEVLAFARRDERPAQVVTVMRDLAETQRRLGLP